MKHVCEDCEINICDRWDDKCNLCHYLGSYFTYEVWPDIKYTPNFVYAFNEWRDKLTWKEILDIMREGGWV